METIYILDGSGYIFRAFYATPPLSNESGMPTNAVYGFTRMVLKLLRDVSPKYLAVAFDNKEPTFRHRNRESKVCKVYLRISSIKRRLRR